MRAKEGNLFKLLFFGVEDVISVKHISSAPKGESSSTVEQQLQGEFGGAGVLPNTP
jgi:hypothetical protein